MITNPKDFFQQVQNLVEEVALKIKAISSSLSSYLTKADAEATYLDKTEAANTYLGKSETATRATVADSATSADKATNDANGNNISNTYLKSATASSTYLKQTDAQSKYLGKTAKAESAKTADTATSATSAGSATKAIQDSDGNVISGTYLKNATAEATYAKKSEIPEVDTSNLVLKSGNRGLLAGYEEGTYAGDFFEGNKITVEGSLPDSIVCSDAYEFTLPSDVFGTAWTKVFVCNVAPSSVFVGGSWGWASEEVPTFKGPGYLVCHWCGVSGVASYVHTFEVDNNPI